MADLYSRLMDGLAMAQQGAQVKKRRTLADLASQAYGADPDAQRGYVQQAIGVDPSAGFQLGKSLGTDRDQVQARLAQEAGIFSEAPDEQKAAMYPRLAAHAKQLGFQVPDAYDPRMLPMIQKIAMAGVGTSQTVQSTYIDAQGNRVAILRNGQTQVLGQNAPNNQIIDTGNGFFGVNKGNLQANPVMVGGGQPQAPADPQASVQSGPMLDPTKDYPQLAANFPGTQVSSLFRSPEHNTEVGGVPNSQHMRGTAGDFVVPKAEQAQFIAKARALGYEVIPEGDHVHVELPPGRKAASAFGDGQQLRSVPKPGNQPHTIVPLSSDEVAQLGLPPGTFAQRDTVTGEVKFGPAGVQGPKPLSEYQRQQLQMKSGKAKAALSGTVADLDRMGSAVRKVMNSPGLDRITGIMGALPNIPGSDAANAEADLDALKSQIAFAVLAKMRAMSPTGGALGSVSDAEGKRLEANLAALDKAQSADQMRARLQDILDYIDSSKGNLQDAYDEQFGDQVSQPAAPQSPSGWSIQKVN